MQTFYTNVKVTLTSTFEKCRFLDGNTHCRHPNSDVFLGLVNRTRTIGFLVVDRKRVGGVDRTVRSPDTEGVVLQSFTEDGTRSIRNV
jgi:hypothetical protein